VLDAHPRRHGPSRELLARLTRLARGEPEEPPVSEPAPTAAPQPEPPPITPSALALEERLRAAGLQPPHESELNAEDLAALRSAGRAIRVSRSLHFHPDVLTAARERVVALAAANGGQVTLAQLRDELKTSRKFAQALLEHMDAEKVTLRRGDAHILRRSVQGC
jgi:selenocysteine-specific elongation factor